MDLLYQVMNALASINAFLLFGLLAFRRNNSLPNLAISTIMLVPALYFANSLLMLNGQGWNFSHLFFIVELLAILYAPSVAIYIYALLGKPFKKLLPVFIISGLIGLIPIYLWWEHAGMEVAAQQSFFLQLIQGPYPDKVTFYSVVFYSFQQLVFIYLLWLVVQTKKRALGFHSNLDRTKLLHLQNFMTLLVVFNFFIVILYVAFDILFVEYFLLPFIVSAIYSFIVYYAFRNNTIFTKQDYRIHLKTALELEQVEEAPVTVNGADNGRQTAIVQQIEQALHSQGLLKDEQLSINKLAQEIGQPVKVVSQVINTQMDSNFYDLVNSRRVAASKILLQQKPEFTIEGIAYEVGFNSRASFYRAFKKYTNTTPSAYLKSLQAEAPMES